MQPSAQERRISNHGIMLHHSCTTLQYYPATSCVRSCAAARMRHRDCSLRLPKSTHTQCPSSAHAHAYCSLPARIPAVLCTNVHAQGTRPPHVHAQTRLEDVSLTTQSKCTLSEWARFPRVAPLQITPLHPRHPQLRHRPPPLTSSCSKTPVAPRCCRDDPSRSSP